jgi:hypothetical protein
MKRYLKMVQKEGNTFRLESVKRIALHPLYILLAVIVAFLVAFVSVLSGPRVQQMSSNPFFIFQIIPVAYWIEISVIVGALFFIIPHLKEKRYRVLFVLASILLIICFRMVFPIEFTTVPAYEPDATRDISIVNSWVTSGINFGIEGAYQHNFPMSYLVAFTFIKLGVPLDTFFRVAPFFIYALDIIFLYLLVEEVMPENKKKSALPALSVFLFSFSSLGYWVTVHYCPDLFGSLMFFVCLYLGVRFAKAGEWSVKSLLPVLVSLFVLILSHHLSTLYLIVTFLGLSFSVWFFKSKQFKGGALSFFILAIYTYTLWFAYGSLVYPSFFNVYIYFSGFGSPAQQSASAGLLTNLSFAIYPVFILVLFAIEFLRTLHIQNSLSLLKHVREKLREIRMRESDNTPLVFSVGFIFVLILFVLGFAAPVLFGVRILEVLCIGLYPLASLTLFKLTDGKSSRKKKAIIFVIILLVILTSVMRYYIQIQRRVLFP